MSTVVVLVQQYRPLLIGVTHNITEFVVPDTYRYIIIYSIVRTILKKISIASVSEVEEIQSTNSLTVRPIISISHHHVDRENLLPDGGFIHPNPEENPCRCCQGIGTISDTLSNE